MALHHPPDASPYFPNVNVQKLYLLDTKRDLISTAKIYGLRFFKYHCTKPFTNFTVPFRTKRNARGEYLIPWRRFKAVGFS
jgi:hypothetical protein